MDIPEELKKLLPDAEPEVVPTAGLRIPVCAPALGEREMAYLKMAINEGMISGVGEFVEKFEVAFAKATGAKFAVSTNSGTSALHLAYRLIGIAPGDEVIVPNFTMVSTVSPLVTEFKAVPVFVDADEYGQIDVAQIEAKITPKTKAIVGVHIYGHPCDIDAIEALAKKYNLKTVYDAAEAHGAMYKGKKMGEFGSAVCYSFYANKVITAGEGGMVTVNDESYHARGKRLIDEYFSDERHFWHEDLGYSFRLNNLSAAIGLAQTERLDELVGLHRKTGDLYRDNLRGVDGLSFLPESKDVMSVRWMHSIMIDKKAFGIGRNELRKMLGLLGIETRTFFIPMHMQPSLRQFVKPEDVYPVSEKLCGSGMYLPSSSMIMESTIERVSDKISLIHHEAMRQRGSDDAEKPVSQGDPDGQQA